MNNVQIMLSTYSLSIDQTLNAFSSLNLEILDPENLTKLKNILASCEDSKKQILEFDGDASVLDDIEEFAI